MKKSMDGWMDKKIYFFIHPKKMDGWMDISKNMKKIHGWLDG